MYFVYALYNGQCNKIYIGQTENLERRVSEHNDSSCQTHKYTRSFPGRWVLIFQEEFISRSEALKREKQLKSFRGREFIKKHIPL